MKLYIEKVTNNRVCWKLFDKFARKYDSIVAVIEESKRYFYFEYSRIDGLFEITWIKIGKTLLNSIESAISKLNVGTKNFDKGSSSSD